MSPYPGTRVPVSLRRLFPRSSFVGCADVRVSDATDHSNECHPGQLFAVIQGTQVDGVQFVGEAITRGATSLLLEQPLPDVSVPQCVVPNARKAYAELQAALLGHPTRSLRLAAVTGTNGKTTVTWLLRSLLKSAGIRCGLLGTVEYDDGDETAASSLTTPSAGESARWLARMVTRRTTHAAVELSSHALDQDRAAGIEADAVVVTNITQDHFDYHGDFESYLSSKSRIVERLKSGGSLILNVDDEGCRQLHERLDQSIPTVSFGIDSPANIRANAIEESLAGCRFGLTIDEEQTIVSTSLVGRHNISDCLAAAAVAHRFGMTIEQIAVGLESATAPPGRMERIDRGQPFDVFVDYAHTDDALARCLACCKTLTTGRVICVFGAGGDRDRSKRPLLGKAATLADLAIVTSDNPRTENPKHILEEILSGFRESDQQPVAIVDRAAAIRHALEIAQPGDCVIVAGKGHETTQTIGTTRLPFDDRDVVANTLDALGSNDSTTRIKIPA
jgi:UDP-N-acetylmuramoyl-L-alanyl-D-glutamate--2,6-diaminopimelate ligase